MQRAIAMTGSMLNYSDFAILLRSSSLSRQIESALGKAGIPYRMVGGHRFFDRYEIKVLLDYLRTISQPQNSDALARIINIPQRKVGEVAVKALLEEAETQKLSLWSLILDAVQGRKKPKTQLNKSHDQGLGIVVNLILNARKKLAECTGVESPLELLQYVIQKISWQKHLEDKDPENHEERWANVEELLIQAVDTLASGPKSCDADKLPEIEDVRMEVRNSGEEALSRFLANVALSTEVQQDENETVKSKVTISTIHAAKGLEWPVVFVPAAYDGSIPHSRAEDQDEERRLLYVAMTRAQSLLYISCPRRSSQAEEITLTSFLPPHVVKGRFADRGPTFTSGLVETIAGILKRPLPSEEGIIIASLTVRSIEDNMWSANGEADKEGGWEYARQNDESHTNWEPPAKMRRTESSTRSVMNETPQYPVSFMSASRVNIISQTTTMSQFKNSEQPKKEAAPRQQVAGKKLPTSKGGKIQGTLGNFLKSNQVRQTQQFPEQVEEIPIPLPPLKRSIPEEFSTHRLKTNCMNIRPTPALSQQNSKPYAFLSSSPESLKPMKGGEVAVTPASVTVGTRPLRGTSTAAATTARAAQTFHMTTVQQVQGFNSTGRKTLGIRRTFNGWADRMAREEKRS